MSSDDEVIIIDSLDERHRQQPIRGATKRVQPTQQSVRPHQSADIGKSVHRQAQAATRTGGHSEGATNSQKDHESAISGLVF